MSRTYTPKQRKQLAECFRAAKKHLWDGVSEVDLEGAYLTRYVCSAIARTRAPRVALARTEVARRLAGCITVGSWLNLVAGVPWGDLTTSALQEYRHAWLDSLISEFESNEVVA